MKLWLKISFIQGSFTFKQKENTSAPTERKVDKIMAINNVVNPTRIAKGYGWEYLIFKPDYSYWPFDNELAKTYLSVTHEKKLWKSLLEGHHITIHVTKEKSSRKKKESYTGR
ncbi:hypothetical protein MCANUFG4_02191 [Mycoplasmopsis canis UFG4]|uniref:Uncharacterized protein n=1 Tax=Mycoplasmopsis canis UFG4 TaxID=1131455 RepID=I1A5T4_9BACT|nr:hypothetical protein [Mycoplasmopsis canis]EIE41855.1 hypothetical protein MCANUFG4_02191 [Mycoplasmopsis canis UFG4]